MGAPKTVDEPAVVAMLEAGATPMEVASKLKVSASHAERILSQHKLDTPAIRQRLAAQRVARIEHRRQTMKALLGLKVPPWVRSAGLVDDYRDQARVFGEHAAARHCRRLTAEMRRASA